MDEELKVNIINDIFGTLDGVFDKDDIDGIEILGSLLALPDEKFDVIKPALLSSIEQSFNDPEAHLALAQMMNYKGVKIEDLTSNFDNLIQAIDELTPKDVELTETKKDFLKYMFASFTNSMNNFVDIPHRILQIPIELCRENAKLPTYATDGSAAMDIYATEDYTINPGETVLIPIGIKVNIPIGYALLIQPRSGLSRKTKLRVANTPGLIDSDYHEEIGVIIENIEPPLKEAGTITLEDGSIEDASLFGSSFTIEKGERFAQMRLVEVPMVNWLPVKSLGSFENDHGEGFGSTGTK